MLKERKFFDGISEAFTQHDVNEKIPQKAMTNSKFKRWTFDFTKVKFY